LPNGVCGKIEEDEIEDKVGKREDKHGFHHIKEGAAGEHHDKKRNQENSGMNQNYFGIKFG